MLKSITLSLLTVLFGATAVAQARCGNSCCAQAAPCCSSGAPAAPADEHSNMPMPTAKAPQATRSFSYQPSTGYSPARGMSQQGRKSGVRDATSKSLGNY
jgi:hypothetical protein